MNVAEAHLHHMARRHHATMKKLDGVREKFTGFTRRGLSTIETGAAAWLGSAVGKRESLALPLGFGMLLLAGSYFWGGVPSHGANIGNGLVASYFAAKGRDFGYRMRKVTP